MSEIPTQCVVWLAIQAQGREKLLAALEVSDVRRVSWLEGLNAAHRGTCRDWDSFHASPAKSSSPDKNSPESASLFVSPPLDGWCLCIGRYLSELIGHEPQKVSRKIARLSELVQGVVCYFALGEPTGFQAWMKADLGTLRRAVARSGTDHPPLLEIGEPTSAEKEPLPAKDMSESLPYAIDVPYDPLTPTLASGGNMRTPSSSAEEAVMRVAAGWSVDPRRLVEMADDGSQGWLGCFRRAVTSTPVDRRQDNFADNPIHTPSSGAPTSEISPASQSPPGSLSATASLSSSPSPSLHKTSSSTMQASPNTEFKSQPSFNGGPHVSLISSLSQGHVSSVDAGRIDSGHVHSAAGENDTSRARLYFAFLWIAIFLLSLGMILALLHWL